MKESLSGQEMYKLEELFTKEYGFSKINNASYVGYQLAHIVRKKLRLNKTLQG